MRDTLNQTRAKVIIIGGGIIGCSIAYYLAKLGVEATVIEKENCVGSAASWAAAGILACHASTQNPYAELCRHSLALYPALAKELQTITDINIEFTQSGILYIFLTEAEKKNWEGLAQRRLKNGYSAEILSSEDAQALEPSISKKILGGVYFPDDAQVRNPRLVRALARAATKLGTKFLTGYSVNQFLFDGNQVIGVKSSGGHIFGDQFVIAAGPWSHQVTDFLDVNLPVKPAKGQMIIAETAEPIINRPIHGLETYIVPRADGKLWVGATVEDAGFDDRTTLSGIHQILESAIQLVPALAKKTLLKTSAGLRPKGRGKPYLGRLTKYNNVIVASGHYKNGILLAPITGKLIAELITQDNTSLSLEPFSINQQNSSPTR